MPDWLSWEWFWLWLGRLADLASLVAAVAAYIAAKKIVALKNKLVFNARMEPLVNEIRQTLEPLSNFADSYPRDRVRIEASLRQCLVRVYRHSEQLSPDVQSSIADLKTLEKELDSPHTSQVGGSDMSQRKSVIEDIIIKMQIVAAHIDETRISRQIGGEDA